MQFNNRLLDIRSRGEVTEYLKILLKKDQIKDCEHLKIEEKYLHTFHLRQGDVSSVLFKQIGTHVLAL